MASCLRPAFKYAVAAPVRMTTSSEGNNRSKDCAVWAKQLTNGQQLARAAVAGISREHLFEPAGSAVPIADPEAGDGQVGFDVVERRIERQGFAVSGDGGGIFSLARQHHAQIHQSRDGTRIGLEHTPVVRFGFGVTPLLLKPACGGKPGRGVIGGPASQRQHEHDPGGPYHLRANSSLQYTQPQAGSLGQRKQA